MLCAAAALLDGSLLLLLCRSGEEECMVSHATNFTLTAAGAYTRYGSAVYLSCTRRKAKWSLIEQGGEESGCHPGLVIVTPDDSRAAAA
jgi:hypothetical protein